MNCQNVVAVGIEPAPRPVRSLALRSAVHPTRQRTYQRYNKSKAIPIQLERPSRVRRSLTAERPTLQGRALPLSHTTVRPRGAVVMRQRARRHVNYGACGLVAWLCVCIVIV